MSEPKGPFGAARHKIQIVFDGPPGPESGRFVEVEQGGESIAFGDWIQREDGYWVLELPLSVADFAVLEAAQRAREAKEKYIKRGLSEWGNYMTAIGALTNAVLLEALPEPEEEHK